MTFYERYCELCANRGIKPHSRKTADMIGVSNAVVTAWKNGAMPRTETLEKLAAFFGVTVEYLISGRRDDAQELINDDPELTEFLQMLATRDECRMLFHLSKDATKEDVELAVKIIEQLRGREK